MERTSTQQVAVGARTEGVLSPPHLGGGDKKMDLSLRPVWAAEASLKSRRKGEEKECGERIGWGRYLPRWSGGD